jgi:hypothetical protein
VSPADSWYIAALAYRILQKAAKDQHGAALHV